VQKEVWRVAKRIAFELAKKYPEQITSEYKVAQRPPNRVLVDYNQNAWGRTLASVYSLRPKPQATVSTPLAWEEVENGIDAAEMNMDTVPQRMAEVGDLFKPVLQNRGRCKLEALA
jgi:bifunctional non-homologous end joining protein LigD